MKLTIIHCDKLENLATCQFLSVFFPVNYMRPEAANPINLNGTDVILIDFSNVTASECKVLESRWNYIKTFPILCLVDQFQGTEFNFARRLQIENIVRRSDGISLITSQIQSLCKYYENKKIIDNIL